MSIPQDQNLLYFRMSEPLVEWQSLPRTRGTPAGVALLTDSRDEAKGETARRARRPVPALSVPHHSQLHPDLPQRIESRQGHRREEGDRRARGVIMNQPVNGNSTPVPSRPLSPNIQIYRPQLTAVLSIANRITGVTLSLGAVGLVIWLGAAADGPRTYGLVQSAIGSWVGQIVLFGCTVA